MAKKKFKVYSTPDCPYCKAAKQFLKANKVDFENIDVSKNQKAAHEMVEKSGQMGVPVIDTGNEIIVGFDQDKLEKAIKV
jgi:glutaredoxin 3